MVPRPIAWVSSLSAEGVANLAPHSFCTVASARPPIVQFTSVGHKDSLRNVGETGEFVISLAGRPLMGQVNRTSAPFEANDDGREAAEHRSRPGVRLWLSGGAPARE